MSDRKTTVGEPLGGVRQHIRSQPIPFGAGGYAMWRYLLMEAIVSAYRLKIRQKQNLADSAASPRFLFFRLFPIFLVFAVFEVFGFCRLDLAGRDLAAQR